MIKGIFKLGVALILISFLLIISANSVLSSETGLELKAKDSDADLPILDILLRVIKDVDGPISHIEVDLKMSAVERKPEDRFIIKVPVKYTVVSGIADRIEDLRVTDDEGRVDLKQLEDESAYGGMVIWRKWQATRPITGSAKIHYRARMPKPGPRVPGPPYFLSLNGGGVSGAGCGFMALPEESGDFKLRLTWDLEALGPGSSGVSSLGDDNFETIGPIDRLFQSYYLAGPLGRYPEQGSGDGFSSAWLGNPPFDVQELGVWSAKAYKALSTFFRDENPSPYRFFMRVGPADTGGGGTALFNSFMLFVPEEPELARDPRGTVFHEMTHKWVGGIEGSPGAVFWFTEGLTVHYTRTVQFRAGLSSSEEFLDDVNGTVRNYMTNPHRNMPNKDIEKNFWQDRNVQRLPYQRGSLYFAYLDGKIRAASQGKKSLDDVILSLFEKRTTSMFENTTTGNPLTKYMLLEALEKEIGPSVLSDFDDIIIRGKDFIPDSNAFGPDFVRIPYKYRVFELGFDERKSIYASEKRVTGLVSGSAAEKAGLKNGDQILNKINLPALRSDENLKVKLKMKRGEKTLEIEYLPRGESVDIYKWVPKTEVSEQPGSKTKSALPNLPMATKNQGTFNGQTVAYTTLIEETVVRDDEKGLEAKIVSISYIRDNIEDIVDRPVIFIFNGGPIVPSMYLHIAAFGPKRIAFPDDLNADPETFPLVDNTYTVLDIADLVFFDPAGTGFSRVSQDIPPDAYFSVEADARQLTQFLQAWSQKHGRVDSPKYLFGESYGTLRAAVAAQQICELDPPIRLDGVFLMGQALNIVETSSRPGNMTSYVISLPTLAALGWYHGRVEKKGRTLDQFLDEVRLFARTEYLTALFQGRDLPSDDQDRIAGELAAFTGLPLDLYIKNDLKIHKVRFRSELLKDKNLVLGYYDGRYTAAAVKEGDTPDASRQVSSAIRSGLNKYAEESLKIELTDYIFRAPVKGLEGWKWGGTTPFSDWPYMESIRKAMTVNPNLHVVVAAGYYDLTTTIGMSEYAIAHSGWPKDRVRMAHYEGGHMAYSVEDSLIQMMGDVRSLISKRK